MALSIALNLGLSLGAVAQSIGQASFSSVSSAAWYELSRKVESRLYRGVPFAQPCFDEFNSTACDAVRSTYLDEVSRAHSPGAYIQTQWETCQRTNEQCLLNYVNPHDMTPTLPPRKCQLGSVSGHYIDVRKVGDVQAAFEFARKTRIPLVVKNTGHDYKGRSSAPHSLALWTHNLKNISYNPEFIPEGCKKSSPAITVGAGVQWGEAYPFAEEHNLTIVGGSDRSVGVAGGWLQGGGHGALSNTMGLGVDRVLQFKVVTPDGKYRVVNECKNKDLFFALRGGGGGTFGVVLESTILASPRVQLQTVIVSFSPNSTTTKELWTILADNAVKWADEGWGGFSMSGVAILINPKASKEGAASSMAPLVNFGQRLKKAGATGTQVVMTEFPSWAAFFKSFTEDHVAVVGSSLALASRLISKDNFRTASDRSALVSGLLAADAETPGLIILMTTPASYPGNGKTSVTDAWRSSLYHVTVISSWNWNATVAEKREHYRKASRSIDHLRRITPDAAYVNEADVYEPNHEVSFWGKHYPELLRIKKKYDPEHTLECWHCVGWNPSDPRYSCYL